MWFVKWSEGNEICGYVWMAELGLTVELREFLSERYILFCQAYLTGRSFSNINNPLPFDFQWELLTYLPESLLKMENIKYIWSILK